ncbi:MAG: lamin tail domain-containing protein [Acidobacteriota bacterium]|nr:lamin tail domain-containing protein [Acidobacteriota bacterium]
MRLAWLGAVFFGAASLNAQVVISQVFGGGGNSGATLKNDFIELFNKSAAAVNVTGWTVQYGPSTGTTWQATTLSGSIAPGQYYLVQESPGAGGTTNLPTPDATGTIAMSATAGKVALVNNATLLTGTGCPFVASVNDFVGYGTGTNCSEGTGPTATLSNTTAAFRAGAGCTDTNNNATDFSTGAPNPRNSASPLNPCSSGLNITNSSPLLPAVVNQFYTVTFTATGGSGSGYTFTSLSSLPSGLMLNGAVLSGTPSTTTGSPFSFTIQISDSAATTSQKTFSLAVTAAPSCVPTSTIAQVQGSGNTSPLVGQAVTISGIVTGRKSNGFFIQMPPPGDGNPATSDGVFVFSSSAPTSAAAAGNIVCVSGTVAEFAPSSDPTSPTATEIAQITNVFSTSTGNALPAPVVLAASDLDPAGGVFQLEKYEGMRVQVNSLTVVAPTQGTINETTATSTSTGMFFGVITGVARPFREPGIQLPDPLPAAAPCCVPRFDSNPEILGVNSLGQTGSTAIDVSTGATVTSIVGPLDFAERYYTIDPDPATPPVVTNNTLTFTAVPPASSSELTIASFNMQRFFDTVDDPSTSDAVLTPAAFANRLNKASLAIRKVLLYPDIVGVEEQENIGTVQAVATKVNSDAAAAGDPNPNYQAYLIEGNDIGGIDVGFLVKTPRVNVIDVVQYGKDTTYIDPTTNSAALLNDRPPLVLRATVNGLPVTVIVNHLRSLSGLDGDTPGAQRIRAKREAQAEYLANLIQGFQSANPSVNIASIGDYNAFEFNDGYADVIGVVKGTPAPINQVVAPPAVITNPALIDLVDTLPASQRYSYTFSGSAQEIDHVLVNQNLLARLSRFAIARNNADFPEIYRNDSTRPERISDHDMPVAYFAVDAPPPSALGAAITAKSGPSVARQWTLTVTNPGSAPSTNTAVNSFSLTQTSGRACTPVVSAPLPSLGTIPANGGSAMANIQIDFTGCPLNARFRLVTNITGNGGAAIGTLTLNNQFQ